MSFLFGSEKKTTSVPEWVKQPILDNIQRAKDVANLGYVAYHGPDVAAFTPMQQASFQNTNDAMTAFGMAAPTNAMAGIPQPQTFAGGVQGYSSAGLYQQALDVLRQKNPQQYAALMGLMPNAGLQPPSGGSGGGGGSSRPTTPTAPTGQNLPSYGDANNYQRYSGQYTGGSSRPAGVPAQLWGSLTPAQQAALRARNS